MVSTSTHDKAVASDSEPAYRVRPGRPHPLGATPDADGANFALFSRHATAVQLLLFENHDDAPAVQVFTLDPAVHKTSTSGTSTYGRPARHALRLPRGRPAGHQRQGPPFQPEQGAHRPLRPGQHQRPVGSRGRLRAGGQPRDSRCAASSSTSDDYDWEGDRPLSRPMDETDHLRDARRRLHHVARPRACSTRAPSPASIEKIPYLKSLGVTAVELLPVFEFDDSEVCGIGPGRHAAAQLLGLQHRQLLRARTRGYCCRPEEGAHVREFRDMVKALHQAGHRGDPRRGLQPHERGQPRGPDDQLQGASTTRSTTTSCPTTSSTTWTTPAAATRSTATTRSSRSSSSTACEYWVREMHVDGFRFDEGSVLVARPGRRAAWPTRRCCGRSSCRRDAGRTPRSSPRPGTPPGSTRSATSPATAGPSGTAGTATTSGAS